jgi:hypothetical protein
MPASPKRSVYLMETYWLPVMNEASAMRGPAVMQGLKHEARVRGP